MHPSRTSTWTLPALAALAALLASSESSASCGDYLQLNGKHGVHAARDSGHLPGDRVPTCRGPGCRQGEPAVPIAPPIVQPQRAPVDADNRDSPRAATAGPSRFALSLHETPRIGVNLPPLRPPRD
jgi:hypothetical protein